MKWQLLIILVLALIPAAFADTIYGIVGKPANLYATIVSTDFYPSTQANITIVDPTLATAVSNKAMTNIAVGRYVYNYTPNITGEYLVSVQFYNSTGLLGTGTNLLESQSPNLSTTGGANMSLVNLLAIALVIATFIYLAFKLDKEYIHLKLLLLLVSFSLIILMAFSAVESKLCYPIYTSGSSVSLSCVADGSISSTILFWIVVTIYGVFFLYVGAILGHKAIKALMSIRLK